jgi:head-tail adaptor
MRHVVTIQRRIEAQTTSGEVQWAWQDWHSNVRARIDTGRLAEDMATRDVQVQAEAEVRIYIRWRPGVVEKMRVQHVAELSTSPQVYTYYDIIGVDHIDERRHEILLRCVRRSYVGFRD